MTPVQRAAALLCCGLGLAAAAHAQQPADARAASRNGLVLDPLPGFFDAPETPSPASSGRSTAVLVPAAALGVVAPPAVPLAPAPVVAPPAAPALAPAPAKRAAAPVAAPPPARMAPIAPAPTVAPAPSATSLESPPDLLATVERWRPASASCTADVSAAPLTLMAALEQVLCKSPLLNQALLLVDERQAGADAAASQFKPRVSLSAELSSNRIPTTNSGSGYLTSSLTGSLGLSWTLFDFGARAAGLDQARQLVSSARSSQTAVALATVNQALQLYVDAAVAQARLDSLREAEGMARRSLEVAQAKHEAHVASLAEKLQAQTAAEQAALDRVRAEGAFDSARGALAVALGRSADQPLRLAPVASAFPAARLPADTSNWVTAARLAHPRVESARAEMRAQQAVLDRVVAEGKGNLSLFVGVASSRDLSTPGSRFERSTSGSAVASFPLYDGGERRALEAQALAQVENRKSALEATERDVELDLWRNARQAETETRAHTAATQLEDVARRSYEITLGRYRAGVASILELLTTQAAWTSARAQLTQAEVTDAQARLRLLVAAGGVAIAPPAR